MNVWYAALPAIIQESVPVTILTAVEYPSLFITWLLCALKKTDRSVIALEVTSPTLAEVQRQLSSSFLGSHYTYWLRGIHELEAADYKQFMHFMSVYTGPHAIAFFLIPDERRSLPSSLTTISLPERITYEDYIHLLLLYDARLKERPAIIELVQQIFKQYQTISLEQAMLIMEYLPLIGKSVPEFLDLWLPRLITTDQSLFVLSQAFFAKDLSECLFLWQEMREQYVDQFWTVYWSEQLFRAYYLAKALQMRDTNIDLKRMSARLPYSFIKRDYKRWSPDQLSQAHQLITQIELDLKSGASTWQLDAFYVKAITL